MEKIKNFFSKLDNAREKLIEKELEKAKESLNEEGISLRELRRRERLVRQLEYEQNRKSREEEYERQKEELRRQEEQSEKEKKLAGLAEEKDFQKFLDSDHKNPLTQHIADIGSADRIGRGVSRVLWDLKNMLGFGVESSIETNGETIAGEIKLAQNEVDAIQQHNENNNIRELIDHLNTIKKNNSLAVNFTNADVLNYFQLTQNGTVEGNKRNIPYYDEIKNYVNTQRQLDGQILKLTEQLNSFENSGLELFYRDDVSKKIQDHNQSKSTIVNWLGQSPSQNNQSGVGSLLAYRPDLLNGRVWNNKLQDILDANAQAMANRYGYSIERPLRQGYTLNGNYYYNEITGERVSKQEALGVPMYQPGQIKAIRDQYLQEAEQSDLQSYLAFKNAEIKELLNEYSDNRKHLQDSKEYWNVGEGYRLGVQAHANDPWYTFDYLKYEMPQGVGSSMSSANQALGLLLEYGGMLAGAGLTLVGAPVAGLLVPMISSLVATPFEIRAAYDENYAEIATTGFEAYKSMLLDPANGEKWYNAHLNELRHRSLLYWKQAGFTDEQIKEYTEGSGWEDRVLKDYFTGLTKNFAVQQQPVRRLSLVEGNNETVTQEFLPIQDPIVTKAEVRSGAGLQALFDADNMRVIGELPILKILDFYPVRYIKAGIGLKLDKAAERWANKKLINRIEADASGRVTARTGNAPIDATTGAVKPKDGKYVNGFKKKSFTESMSRGFSFGSGAADALGLGVVGHTIFGSAAAVVNGGLHLAKEILPDKLRRMYSSFERKFVTKYQAGIDILIDDKEWLKAVGRYAGYTVGRGIRSAASEGAEEAVQYLNSKEDFANLYGWRGMSLSELISNDLAQGGKVLDTYLAYLGMGESPYLNDLEYWLNLRSGAMLGGLHTTLLQTPGTAVGAYKGYKAEQLLRNSGIMNREYDKIDRVSLSEFVRQAIHNREGSVLLALDYLERVDSRRKTPFFSSEDYAQRRKDAKRTMAMAKDSDIRQILESKGFVYGSERYIAAVADLSKLKQQSADNRQLTKDISSDIQQIYNSPEFQQALKDKIDSAEDDFVLQYQIETDKRKAGEDAVKAAIKELNDEAKSLGAEGYDETSTAYKQQLQEVRLQAEDAFAQQAWENYKRNIVSLTLLANKAKGLIRLKALMNTIDDFFKFLKDKANINIVRGDAKLIKSNIQAQLDSIKNDLSAFTNKKITDKSTDAELLELLNTVDEIVDIKTDDLIELELAKAMINANLSVVDAYYRQFYNDTEKDKKTGKYSYVGKDAANDIYSKRIDAILKAKEDDAAIDRGLEEFANGNLITQMTEAYEKERTEKIVSDIRKKIKEQLQQLKKTSGADTLQKPTQTNNKRSPLKTLADKRKENRQKFEERRNKAKAKFQKNRENLKKWSRGTLKAGIPFIDKLGHLANDLLYAAKYGGYKIALYFEDIQDAVQDIDISQYADALKLQYARFYAKQSYLNLAIRQNLSTPEEVESFIYKSNIATGVLPEPQEGFIPEEGEHVDISSHYDRIVTENGKTKIYHNQQAIDKYNSDNTNNADFINGQVQKLKDANTDDETFKQQLQQIAGRYNGFPIDEYVKYRNVEGIEEAIVRKMRTYVPTYFILQGIEVRQLVLDILAGNSDEIDKTKYPASIDKFIEDIEQVKLHIDALGLTIVPGDQYYHGTTETGNDLSSQIDILLQDEKGMFYVIDVRAGYKSIYDRYNTTPSAKTTISIKEDVEKSAKQSVLVLQSSLHTGVKQVYLLPVVFDRVRNVLYVEKNSDGKYLSLVYNATSISTEDLEEAKQKAANLVEKINNEIDIYNSLVEEASRYTNKYQKLQHIELQQFDIPDEYAQYYNSLSLTYDSIVSNKDNIRTSIENGISLENYIWEQIHTQADVDVNPNVRAAYENLISICDQLNIALQFISPLKATTEEERLNNRVVFSLLFDAQKAIDWVLQEDTLGIDVTKEQEFIAATIEDLVENNQNFGKLSEFVTKWWQTNFLTGVSDNTTKDLPNVGLRQIAFMNAINNYVNTLSDHLLQDLDNRPKLQQFYSNVLNNYFSKLLDNAGKLLNEITDESLKNSLLAKINVGRRLIEKFNNKYDIFPEDQNVPENEIDAARMISVLWNDLYGPSTAHSPSITEMGDINSVVGKLYYWMSTRPDFTQGYLTQVYPGVDTDNHVTRFILFEEAGQIKLQISVFDPKDGQWKNIKLGFFSDLNKLHDKSQENIERVTHMNRANELFVKKVKALLEQQKKNPDKILTFRVFTNEGKIDYGTKEQNVMQFLFEDEDNYHDLYTVLLSGEQGIGICRHIIDKVNKKWFYSVVAGEDLTSIIGGFDTMYSKQKLQTKSGTIVYFYNNKNGNKIGIPLHRSTIGSDATKVVNLIEKYVSGDDIFDGFNILDLIGLRLYLKDHSRYLSEYNDQRHMVVINRQSRTVVIGTQTYNIDTQKTDLIQAISNLYNVTDGLLLSQFLSSSNSSVFNRAKLLMSDGREKIELPNGLVFTKDDFFKENQGKPNGSTWLGYMMRNNMLTHTAKGTAWKQLNIDNLDLVDKNLIEQLVEKPSVTTEKREKTIKEIRNTKLSGMFNANQLFKVVNEDDVDLNIPEDQKQTLRQFAIDYLKKVTGTDRSGIKFYEENDPFIARLGGNTVAIGAVTSELVKLSVYSPTSVVYHEAFHKIVELLMTAKERNQLYDAYRNYRPNATELECAEGLADLFMDWCTKQFIPKNSSWFKKIISFFKSVLFGIGMVCKFGLNNTRDFWTIFKDANGGKYATRTISEENKKRFQDLFGDNLFFTVRNRSTKLQTDLLWISNSSQLDDMVKSLSYYIMESKGASTFNPIPSAFVIDAHTPNLLNAEDFNGRTIMENLCGIGKSDSDVTSIDMAFREILEKKEVVEDGKTVTVYPKFAVIADKVAAYIGNKMSIKDRSTEDEEFNEDDSENRDPASMGIYKYDRASHEFRKLDSISLKVKLFFSTIPYTTVDDDGDYGLDLTKNIYNTPTYMPIETVYNVIVNDCHEAKSINELYEMIKQRAVAGNYMYRQVFVKLHSLLYGTQHTGPIYEYDKNGKIKHIDYSREAFACLILGAIRSQKHDFMIAKSTRDKNGNKKIGIKKSNLDRDSKGYSKQWTTFVTSGVVPIFSRVVDANGNLLFANGVQYNDNNDPFHVTSKLFSDIISELQHVELQEINLNGTIYNKNIASDVEALKDRIIISLHHIGIMFSKEALEHMLYTKYGKADCDAIRMWLLNSSPKFKIDVDEDITKISINTFLDLLNMFVVNGNINQKLIKQGYSKNGFVNSLATWEGIYRRISTDQQSLGLNGKKLYSISQNSTISHIIDALNTHDLNNETIRTLMNFGWNISNGAYIEGSIILKAIAEGRAQTLKGHTYLGFKTDNRGDAGTEYKDSQTIDDYMAKYTMLQNGYLIFPTLADKSTWMFISGVEIPGMEFVESKTSTGQNFLDVKNPPSVEYIDGLWRLLVSDVSAQLMLEYAHTERQAIQECMEDLGYSKIDGYEKRGRKPLAENEKIVNYHTPNKDKVTGKIIEPNGTRFLGLTKIVVEENGKVVVYNLNDPNKSSNDMLKLANEKFFNKSLDEQLRIMKLTLGLQVYNEIETAINLGIVTRRNINATWTDKNGVKVEQNVLKDTKTIDNLDTNQLDEDQVNALTAYFMRTMNNTYGGKWNVAHDATERDFKRKIARSFAIASLLADVTTRSIICSEEVQRCFSGHPGAFKVLYDVKKGEIKDSAFDIQKRIGGMISTGEDNVIGLPGIPEYYRCAELNDYEVTSQALISSNMEQLFVDSQIREVYAVKTGDWLTAYTMPIDGLFEQAPALLKELLLSAKKDGQKYANTLMHDINVADGAAYITDKMCENLLRMRGAYSEEIKDAFNILRSRSTRYSWIESRDAFEKIYSTLNIVTTKYTAYGFRLHTINGNNISNIAVPYYNKFALFPIFPSIATGRMSYLYQQMLDLNVDMLLMTSAVKVGSQGSIDAFDDKTRINNDPTNEKNFIGGDVGSQNWKPNIKFNTYLLHFSYLRRQLNTDPEESDRITVGVLMTKIALSNLRLLRSYTDSVTGDKIFGNTLLDRFMGDINALCDSGITQIKDMFFDTNGKIDPIKLHNYLEEQLTSRDANEALLDMIQLQRDPNTGEIDLIGTLAATPNSTWIESILISTINKNIIDIVTPGASYVQRSVFAMEGSESEGLIRGDADMDITINNGNRLLMINEEGSMDAVISITFFEDILPKGLSFTEARQWLIDQGIIGPNAKANTVAYRIPTLAQSSIHALRFVDVVNTVKDTIILPEEFTKITGSDFDIDHLYLCRYNYHQKIHPVYKKPVGKFTTEYEKGSNEYYQNDLISCMLTLLKDVDNSMNSLYKSIDNDTELPKRIADQIPEENSTKADPYNFGSLHELVLRKLDYITGKKGIGPFALNVTNQILCMLYGIEYLENNFTKAVGLTSIGRILDDEDNYVSSWLSGFINGHVDIVKDPWISKLDVNPYTYNMLNMLIRCGWGSVAVWLLSQPIIRDIALADILALSQYSRDVEKTSSQFKARQQAIKEALSEYMTDEEFSEERLFDIVSAQNDTERIFYVKWIKLHNDVLAEFAKNKHLEKVTVDGETYYRNEVQKYAFYAWKSLEPYAFALNNFVQHTKIDTRKHGNSMIAIAKYRQEYLDMVYPKDGRSVWNLFRLRRMVMHSWIHKKTMNAISAPFSILGNYTFAGNEEFINTVLRFARTLAGPNEGLNIDTCKQISNNLITYIKSKYFVNYVQTVLCDEGQSADDYIRNLFVGNWNMNHRLNAMLYQIETNPQYKRLSTNTFINQIFAELLDEDIVVNGRVVLRPNFIVVRDNVNGSKINSDLLIRGWQDLLTDTDVYVRRFARDMIIYAFMSSGEFKGWGKIFEYVPPAFLLGQIDTNVQSFNDFIKELLVNLKIEDSALDDIVANNFMDYRFSRIVPLQDPTTKEYNFINVQDAILFGKYLESDEDVKPYITVPTSNNAGKGVARYNVYKFVGFVRIDDKNSSPVYVMMRKRGYHTQNKRDIYEYGWNFRYGENSYSDDFDITNVALSISVIEDLFNHDGELSVSHDYLLRTFYNYGYDFQTESSSMEDRSIVTEFNDQQKDPFTLNEVTNTVSNNQVPASYEGLITPDANTVFVFGSNPEGRHGAGAAKTAILQFGAIYGQGEGLQGQSYALPTKRIEKSLPTSRPAKIKLDILLAEKLLNGQEIQEIVVAPYHTKDKQEDFKDLKKGEILNVEETNGYTNNRTKRNLQVRVTEISNDNGIVKATFELASANGERTIPESQIIENIKKLYEVARQNPNKQFKIGYTNELHEYTLNGYQGSEMLKMFKDAGPIPSNVIFSKNWTDHWNEVKADTTSQQQVQGENSPNGFYHEQC